VQKFFGDLKDKKEFEIVVKGERGTNDEDVVIRGSSTSICRIR